MQNKLSRWIKINGTILKEKKKRKPAWTSETAIQLLGWPYSPWNSIKGSLNLFRLHFFLFFIIGNYIPSVRIIDLDSHTTYIVCVNFIYKWQDLRFKVDFKWQIFWETFHGSFNLLSEFLPEIYWKEIAE